MNNVIAPKDTPVKCGNRRLVPGAMVVDILVFPIDCMNAGTGISTFRKFV